MSQDCLRSNRNHVKYPKKYNIELPVIDNEVYFSIIEIDGQIDLALAAELADIELKNCIYT